MERTENIRLATIAEHYASWYTRLGSFRYKLNEPDDTVYNFVKVAALG